MRISGTPSRSTGTVRGHRTLTPATAASYLCEAVAPTGLEEIAREEMRRFLAGQANVPDQAGERWEGIHFTYRGDLHELLELRTISAVYLVRRFAVPRPRALLGDEHLRAILGMIDRARSLVAPDSYRTLYLSAAGSDSAVLMRLKAELAGRTGLAVGMSEGDLQIRLRRAQGHEAAGWEVLVRLSPRPLTARAWRVCNMEGALNAAVAHAMVLATRPAPGDTFLNVACGSGTLLVERLTCGPLRRAIGCDTGVEALACARANVAAAGYSDNVELHDWDARALPLADGSVDALCADLPFGHLIGSHQSNKTLYPAIVREAARVARPGARFALITREARLMERLLADEAAWTLDGTLRVSLGDLPARIIVLRRL